MRPGRRGGHMLIMHYFCHRLKYCYHKMDLPYLSLYHYNYTFEHLKRRLFNNFVRLRVHYHNRNIYL